MADCKVSTHVLKLLKKKATDEGLSAKQRRKIVSKATISSSDSSSSEDGKLKITDDEAYVFNDLFTFKEAV